DNVEIEFTPAKAAAEITRRLVAKREPELADARCRFGPDPLLDERTHMFLIGKARDRVVRLRPQGRLRDPAVRVGAKERQPPAMNEVVDEGRDEDRLAGLGQAGNAEPERWRYEVGRPAGEGAQGDPCFVRQV